jgi:hypothetical protein
VGTVSAKAPPALTEAQWQERVVDLATWRGWRCFHVYDSRRSTAGWPDLVMLRGDRMLAWELKRDTGRATRQQLEWLAALSLIPGVDARVVRPSDWPAVQGLLR